MMTPKLHSALLFFPLNPNPTFHFAYEEQYFRHELGQAKIYLPPSLLECLLLLKLVWLQYFR